MKIITRDQLTSMYDEKCMQFIDRFIRRNNEFCTHCSDTKGYMLTLGSKFTPIPISDNGEITSSYLFVARMLNGRNALIITKNRYICSTFWPDDVSIEEKERISDMDYLVAMVRGIGREDFEFEWVLDYKPAFDFAPVGCPV